MKASVKKLIFDSNTKEKKCLKQGTNYICISQYISMIANDFLSCTGHLSETTTIEKIIIYCRIECSDLL